MDLSEFSDAFFEEADELLVDIERQLLEMDLSSPDSEQLNAVFRAAHSIKGGAGTFGFSVLQETTHLLENLLDDARKGELALTRTIVDQFLETKDMLKDQLDAYRNGTAPNQEDFERLCKTLREIGEANKDVVDNPVPGTVPEQSTAAQVGAEAEHGFEIFDESSGASGADDPAARRLRVLLKDVDDKDGELIVEELGNLGKVLSKQGDASSLEILVATDETVEDLESVLCFVVDPGQLSIVEYESVSDSQDTVEIPEEKQAQAEAPEAPEAQSTTPATDEETPSEGTESADPKVAAKPKPRAGESSSIRVAVDKVDQVINLVGELIITQSMLNETVNGLEAMNNSDLYNGINLLQRNARDLQDAVMSIRMLPMDYVFSRFPRLVRDLAGKMGKEIELVTEGEATELDKGLTERIIDPLTHLVRNSLDHGLELPDDREAAGKPRAGQLVLSAQHQGSNILIEVRDDGVGLNREKILAKARANDLPVSENPSDEEVWQLIFAPGFSTAEQVSDLSGRGVGMDVVKRNIHSMGGHVEIMSALGKGTTTRIVLPLTLAILDGMLIRVGAEVYILPVSAIIESLQLRDEKLTSLPGNVPMLKVRDEYYPVVSVYDAMGVRPEDRCPEAERRTAVMVQGGSVKYVMLVDELLGQQQVVVKNLEANYRKIPGVSAATILGDGSVALILDIVDLFRLAKEKPSSVRRSRPEAIPMNGSDATSSPGDDDGDTPQLAALAGIGQRSNPVTPSLEA